MRTKPKKQDPTYFKALSAAAPVFLAKAVIGDLPKGALEKAVQMKIQRKTPWKKGFNQGLKGRGLGRALGASTGVLTAPFYLKGLQLLKSDNLEDKKKGVGMLAGTTAAYQLQKGLQEGYLETRAGGGKRVSALKQALGLGVGRLSYKIPAALMLAQGIASGEKKKGKKALIPVVLGGAAAGTINRLGDEGIKELTSLTNKNYKFRPSKAMARRFLGAGVGGAAGGILGGLVLSKAVSMAKDSLKNKG